MGIKPLFKKPQERLREAKVHFLEVPLLSVYENPEEDTYVKDSCLLNIPIHSFSM